MSLRESLGDSQTRPPPAWKRAAKIHREYLETQNLATQKKTEFEFATRAVERAFHFKIKVGSEYFCPLCGVEGDISARLSGATPRRTGSPSLRLRT
jgi:hypothetical protein